MAWTLLMADLEGNPLEGNCGDGRPAAVNTQSGGGRVWNFYDPTFFGVEVCDLPSLWV